MLIQQSLKPELGHSVALDLAMKERLRFHIEQIRSDVAKLDVTQSLSGFKSLFFHVLLCGAA